MDVIGPGAFPFLLGLIIAACGAGLLLTSLRSKSEESEPARWLVVGAALALLVAYTHSLAYLGFLLATALFVPACLALLGGRDLVRLAVAGAVSVEYLHSRFKQASERESWKKWLADTGQLGGYMNPADFKDFTIEQDHFLETMTTEAGLNKRKK